MKPVQDKVCSKIYIIVVKSSTILLDMGKSSTNKLDMCKSTENLKNTDY